MGAGLFCWALGEVIFTLDPAEITAGSFPGVSDYLWLTFYPAAFLTLGLLVRARVREFYPSLWLDGLLGALAVGATRLPVRPASDRGRHGRVAEQRRRATSSTHSETSSC